MTNLADIEISALRILMLGWQGGGKTGALACLANAGFKIRILDFDGKLGNPLLRYVKPECLGNVDVLTLTDKLRDTKRFVGVSGLPVAFSNGLKALDHWVYVDGLDEVDLGRSRDWGPDTIVVVDTGTAMGRAAKRRTLALNNRTPLNARDSDWGAAMEDEAAFIEKLCSASNAHHVIVNYHMKWLGPREERKGDADAVKEIKEREADLIPTRLYPSAMGSKNAPQNIGQFFDTALLVEPKHLPGGKVQRMIFTQPRPSLDLKVAAELPAALPLETGLLEIFSALTGGIEKCLAAGEKLPRGQPEAQTPAASGVVPGVRTPAGATPTTVATEEGKSNE